ncbi:MAG: pilus assembly protein PilX [Comamonas sp.]
MKKALLMPRGVFTSTRQQPKQRGVALFVVIVFVMLTMLLALWSSRTALFGEMMVGNDADYQRAFEAAQTLVQDAELDIRNENADGSTCSGTGDVCRQSTADQIPLEAPAVGKLLAELDNTPYKCRNGLCTKRLREQDFWNNTDGTRGFTLAQMTSTPSGSPPVGARYGRYTGAKLGTSSSPANPILADQSAPDKGGWYWIEVLPYDESSKNSGLIVAEDDKGNPVLANNYLSLNLLPNVVYRITALAYGRKPSTKVVLQQTYARQKLKD